MAKLPIIFDRFVFEIRYGSGYLYYDKCGQTLLDIMNQREGWFLLNLSPQTGTLENPEKHSALIFTDKSFNFTAEEPSNSSIVEIAEEVSTLWRIIQVNFGLEEFVRLATRFFYFLPCLSIDEAEKRLGKSNFNVNVPQNLLNQFKITKRQTIVVFEKDSIEYRVALNTVTRHEGIRPSEILTMDPRVLSKNQNSYRMAKQRQLSKYTSNPMYAVVLDIDCVSLQPNIVNAKDFIQQQENKVKDYFYSILEDL